MDDKEIAKRIGLQIRAYRERAGLTQDALARLMETTKPAVQHWENGRRLPKLIDFLKLTQILLSNPNQILAEVVEMGTPQDRDLASLLDATRRVLTGPVPQARRALAENIRYFDSSISDTTSPSREEVDSLRREVAILKRTVEEEKEVPGSKAVRGRPKKLVNGEKT